MHPITNFLRRSLFLMLPSLLVSTSQAEQCVGPWDDCRLTLHAIQEDLGWETSYFGGMEFRGNYYFTSDDGVHGAEVWVNDGNSTRLFLDINPGAGNSYPQHYTNVNNSMLFFTAYSPNEQTCWGYSSCLWVTDGTKNGTRTIPKPGSSSCWPFSDQFIEFKGELVLFCKQEMYVSDGTINGTRLVKEFGECPPISTNEIVEFNNQLFFAACNTLWVTDATYDGTHPVSNSAPSTGSTPGPTMWPATISPTQWPASKSPISTPPYPRSPANLLVIDGKLVFTASYPNYGTAIWVSDGTSAGTRMAYDPDPEESNQLSYYSWMTAFMDRGYFRLASSLWFTDGSTSGTRMFLKANGAPRGFHPLWLQNKSEWQLLFLTNDGLWTTDGSLQGTVNFVPYQGTLPSHIEYESFASVNGLVLFQGGPRYNSLTETLVTDGTFEGTGLIDGIEPESPFAEFGKDSILFRGNNGTKSNIYRLQVNSPLLPAPGPRLFHAYCRDVRIEAAEGCLASVTAEDVDDGSIGTGLEFSIDVTLLNAVGNYTVELTVKDERGRFDVCQATVEVKDPSGYCDLHQDLVFFDYANDYLLFSEDFPHLKQENFLHSLVNDTEECPDPLNASNLGDCFTSLESGFSFKSSDGSGVMGIQDPKLPVYYRYPATVLQVADIQSSSAILTFSNSDVFVVGILFRSDDYRLKAHVYSAHGLLGSTESAIHKDKGWGLIGVLSDIPIEMIEFESRSTFLQEWIYGISFGPAVHASCEPITLYAGEDCTTFLDASQIGGEESSGNGLKLSLSKTNFTDAGIFPVELRAQDRVGNSDTCTTNVTIKDPEWLHQNEINCGFEDDDWHTVPCQAVPMYEIPEPRVAKANGCHAEIEFFSPPTFPPFDCEKDILCQVRGSTSEFCPSQTEISWNVVATSDHNSNTRTCFYCVKQLEPCKPLIAVCRNATVFADSDCEVELDLGQIDGGSTGDGIRLSVEGSDDTFQLSGLGSHRVILIAEDSYDNEDRCTATVYVEESALCRPPRAVCQDITVAAQEGCIAIVDAWAVGSKSTGLDLDLRLNQTSFEGLGRFSVELTVDDTFDHTDRCVATVTVEDDKRHCSISSSESNTGLIVGLTVGIGALLFVAVAWAVFRCYVDGCCKVGNTMVSATVDIEAPKS